MKDRLTVATLRGVQGWTLPIAEIPGINPGISWNLALRWSTWFFYWVRPRIDLVIKVHGTAPRRESSALGNLLLQIR